MDGNPLAARFAAIETILAMLARSSGVSPESIRKLRQIVERDMGIPDVDSGRKQELEQMARTYRTIEGLMEGKGFSFEYLPK